MVDLSVYKVQAGPGGPVLLCMRCKDDVRADLPVRPSLERIVGEAQIHEMRAHPRNARERVSAAMARQSEAVV